GLTGGTDRIFERLRPLRRSPAGVYHANIDAILFTVDRVIDRLDGIFHIAEAAASEKLERHDLDVPIDAGDALAIIAFGSDDTGAVGTMAVTSEERRVGK